jgi:hypothetical protein
MHTKIQIYNFVIIAIAAGSILAVMSSSGNFTYAASPDPPSAILNANPNPSSNFNSAPNPSSNFNSAPNPSSNFNSAPNPSSNFNSAPNPSSNFNSAPNPSSDLNSTANSNAALTLNDFDHCVQQKAFNAGHLGLEDVASCYSQVFETNTRPSSVDSSVNNSN